MIFTSLNRIKMYQLEMLILQYLQVQKEQKVIILGN